MGSYDHRTTAILILTMCIIHGSYILVEAQNTSFSYLPFSSPDKFTMVDDVQYYGVENSFLLNSIGYSLGRYSCAKLYYEDTVRMKDVASGAVASFYTSFTFSITNLNYWYDRYGYVRGDGMAFTFSSNKSSVVGDENEGGWLCLGTAATNTQLFAVEFDTYRNPTLGDPSDNHIGVDVNSLNSTWSYNLCGGTLINCTYLVNGGSFTAWIDYDSPSQKLAVYFANGSLLNYVPKPPKPVIEGALPLTAFLDEYMYVGFSGSVGTYNEVHQIEAWQFASSGLPEVVAPTPAPTPASTNSGTSSSSGRKAGTIAGVCAGVGALLLLAGIVIAKRWRRASHTKLNHLVDPNLVPRAFTYKELSKATKNFSRSERLGSGGFGTVYKGVLPSGALVAVKRMRHESKQGEEGFQAEAASLSQIRHRNLVQLRGWCHEEEQLILVYGFMCNGGLDEWLFHFTERNAKAQLLHLRLAESLPLTLRHSILRGVAAALAYLHEECKQCVLHRDIKSSNVLLDEDLNAYLGDFGLARLIDHQKMEKTTMMAGTLGYMAPEMPVTGRATKESDVYSFGVLMLEVMCGMRPLDVSAIERGDGALVDRIWHALETGNLLLLVDPKLGTFPPPDANPYGGTEMQEASGLLISEEMVDWNPSARHTSNAAMEDQKMVTNLLHLGLLCCHPNPEDRPSMRLVSQWLQASESMEMSLPPLPRCKPQARYSRPGFSQMAMIHSLSTSLNSENVQDAGQGSSQSTLPTSDASVGEHASIQASLATISSSHWVYSGR